MQIKKLTPAEHFSTRPLYEEVFSEDSKGFVDYYYTEKTKDNTIYTVIEDEKIRSMLHLNPYDVIVNGKEEKLHYIVAVATQEVYRKRGYMGALLKKALKDMYHQGEPFTYLMPAAEQIYYPYDFRTVYKQTTTYWDGLLDEEDKCRKATAKDAAKIACMSEDDLEGKFDVYTKRDEAYYSRLMKEYESDGGYLVLGERDGKIIWCRPKVAEIPKDMPKIMVRLVDVRRMLLLLDLNYLTAVCFHVTDPLIEENNKCFLITGTEASGVMLMEGKEENSEGTLTVGALTRLIFGEASVEDIVLEDGVEMSDRMKNELKKIVPLSRICLNEVV